jgi:DNA-binding transcriptional MerR regulator
MSTNQPPAQDRFPWEENEPDASTTEGRVEGPTAPVSTADTRAETPSLFDQPAYSDERGEAAAPTAARPVALKEYYAISEVCELVGLKPHVLRYWETQFQVLNPSKNRSGNRVYQRKEIKLILLVKHLLYEEKYTVEGAKAKLDQMRRGGRLQEGMGRALDHQMIAMLRGELHHLMRILAPPGSA